MVDGWREQLVAERQAIDRILRAELKACRGVPQRLRQAMAHSLFGGGKRLRPILVLWTYDALGTGRPARGAVPREQAARAAAAVTCSTAALPSGAVPGRAPARLPPGKKTGRPGAGHWCPRRPE